MGSVVEKYFEKIFSSSNPFSFESILNGIQHTVGDDGSASMGSDFQACEVQQAFTQMASHTTQGLDGMSPIFYKLFWHIMGEDVTTVMLRALNSGIVPKSLNTTFISLIPKIKNPKKVSNFRPVSLCNVIYKSIAKVVVNCLKMANSILDSQSAFLLG